MANDLKYTEETLSGRREHFFANIVDPNKAINFPIQGGAATLMNEAIIDVDKQINWDAGEAIMAQVHDETQFESFEYVEKNFKKRDAVVFQHEFDHINGRLI